MTKLISGALILLLAITTESLVLKERKVEFGDMIAFKARCAHQITFRHFAVYIGETQIPGLTKPIAQTDNTIFERTKGAVLSKRCGFDELTLEEDPFVFNFLDGYKDKKNHVYAKGNDQEIKERISKIHTTCPPYLLLHENCEHLASFVRYGKKISLQYGLMGEKNCILPEAKAMLKYVHEVTECPGDPAPVKPGPAEGGHSVG